MVQDEGAQPSCRARIANAASATRHPARSDLRGLPARRGLPAPASPGRLPVRGAARHAPARGHQSARAARLPELRRRVRLFVSGTDAGGGTPLDRHRRLTRAVRVQLHRAGADAHVRHLPTRVAAGAGSGPGAACAGLAGESRPRRRDARTRMGARRPALHAARGRAGGRARGRVAVLRVQRRLVFLAHVLRRARIEHRRGCPSRSGCSWGGRC